MTKELLIEFIEFDSQEEKEECEFYMDVKGVQLHYDIMEYLGFDFKSSKKLKWKTISKVLIDDKKLRDKLYKYLATLEEYIRAYISNKYIDDIEQEFWFDGIAKRNKIKTNLLEGVNLFTVLKNADFGTLINQVKKLPQIDKETIFAKGVYSDMNLDAVQVLRNAISHHNFLAKYNLKECCVDGEISNSLQNNIKNLRQLLPKRYQYGKNGNGGITADMLLCGITID